VEICRNCGEVEGTTRQRPDTPHHAEVICDECHGFIRWMPKPKNEEQRKKRPPYPKPEDLGIDYCQICLLPKDNLLTNETLATHHINGNARDRNRANFLVVCSACHAMIAYQRTYRMRHYLQSIGIYEETIKRYDIEEE